MNSNVSFETSVDYQPSLQKIMSVDGYDMPKSFDMVKILESGKKIEEKIVRIRLIYFTAPILTNVVLLEINKLGFRPGNFFELLSVSKMNSEVVRNYPIVALGSSCTSKNGFELVPCLDSRIVNKRIYLAPLFGKWLQYCRFLVVEK